MYILHFTCTFYNVVYSTVDTFINLFSKLQTAFSYDVICLIFLFAYKKEICAINSRLKIFFLPICCVSQIKLNLSLAIESAHFYGFREPESSNQFLLKNHAVYCTHYVGFWVLLWKRRKKKKLANNSTKKHLLLHFKSNKFFCCVLN